jgi:vacuolar-type H+-ATPase subunit C/Vma6
MQGLGERAYAYAKACAILSKSFVGKRVASLNNISRLSELDRLVFPKSSRDLPEKELLADLETRIEKRVVDSICKVVKSFRTPPEFFVRLIRGWEYEDLKNTLMGLGSTEPSKPIFTDLGSFGTVNFSSWPDIPAMLQGTEFEYLLEVLDKGSDFLYTELDRHYYSSLWKALLKLKSSDRQASEKILSEEISLRNVIWALRLRTYYQMEAEEVRSHLIFIETSHMGQSQSLAQDAISSLDFALDNRQEWIRWRRVEFLNPEVGIEWTADPRHFQNEAAKYLYRMARHSFHTHPSSLDAIFCFIKIKQFEEDILTSGAEGLGIGMASWDVFSMLGVES